MPPRRPAQSKVDSGIRQPPPQARRGGRGVCPGVSRPSRPASAATSRIDTGLRRPVPQARRIGEGGNFPGGVRPTSRPPTRPPSRPASTTAVSRPPSQTSVRSGAGAAPRATQSATSVTSRGRTAPPRGACPGRGTTAARGAPAARGRGVAARGGAASARGRGAPGSVRGGRGAPGSVRGGRGRGRGAPPPREPTPPPPPPPRTPDFRAFQPGMSPEMPLRARQFAQRQLQERDTLDQEVPPWESDLDLRHDIEDSEPSFPSIVGTIDASMDDEEKAMIQEFRQEQMMIDAMLRKGWAMVNAKVLAKEMEKVRPDTPPAKIPKAPPSPFPEGSYEHGMREKVRIERKIKGIGVEKPYKNEEEAYEAVRRWRLKWLGIDDKKIMRERMKKAADKYERWMNYAVHDQPVDVLGEYLEPEDALDRTIAFSDPSDIGLSDVTMSDDLQPLEQEIDAPMDDLPEPLVPLPEGAERPGYRRGGARVPEIEQMLAQKDMQRQALRRGLVDTTCPGARQDAATGGLIDLDQHGGLEGLRHEDDVPLVDTRIHGDLEGLQAEPFHVPMDTFVRDELLPIRMPEKRGQQRDLDFMDPIMDQPVFGDMTGILAAQRPPRQDEVAMQDFMSSPVPAVCPASLPSQDALSSHSQASLPASEWPGASASETTMASSQGTYSYGGSGASSSPGRVYMPYPAYRRRRSPGSKALIPGTTTQRSPSPGPSTQQYYDDYGDSSLDSAGVCPAAILDEPVPEDFVGPAVSARAVDNDEALYGQYTDIIKSQPPPVRFPPGICPSAFEAAYDLRSTPLPPRNVVQQQPRFMDFQNFTESSAASQDDLYGEYGDIMRASPPKLRALPDPEEIVRNAGGTLTAMPPPGPDDGPTIVQAVEEYRLVRVNCAPLDQDVNDEISKLSP